MYVTGKICKNSYKVKIFMLFCLLNFLVLSGELTLSQTIYTCFAGSSRSTESSTSASLSATPSQDGGTSSQSDQQRPLLAKTSVSSNPNESLESPSAVQAAMATVNSRRNVSYSKIQTKKISNRKIFTLLKVCFMRIKFQHATFLFQ